MDPLATPDPVTLRHPIHPLKVDLYDLFAFETRLRELVAEHMAPLLQAQYQDHERVLKSSQQIKNCTSKLYELQQLYFKSKLN